VLVDDAANDEIEIQIERAALTGFAVASANSNATTSAEPIVTFSASANMTAERVLTAGTNITLDVATPGLITVNASSGTTITTGVKGDIDVVGVNTDWQIVADSVGNTELANMAANTIKANPTAGAADPQDVAVAADSVLARVGGNLVSHPWATLAGTRLTYAAGVMDVDLAAAYAWTGSHTFAARVQGVGIFSTTLAAGTTNDLAIGAVNTVRIAGPGGGAVMNLTGMVPGGDGQWVFIENTSATDILVLMHDVTSTAANRFYCTGLSDMAITNRGGVWVRQDATLQRWIVAIPSYIGISTVALSPTTHTQVRALTLTEGAGINLTTSSASTGSAGFNITVDVAMSQMAANTIKANATAGLADPTDVAVSANSVLARVGGNLVTHPWSTLAGSGLTYSAGVIDVDPRTLDVKTVNTAVTALATNITMVTTTVAANDWAVGSLWRLTGWFKFNHPSAATPTLTVDLLVGGTLEETFVVTPIAPGATDTYPGRVEAIICCRSTGGAGTMKTDVQIYTSAGSTSGNCLNGSIVTADRGLDTTVSNALLLRIRMTTGVASNVLTVVQGYAERLN
jgi:hypothetical protein